MIKRIIRKIRKERNINIGKKRARELGIKFEKPNYIFKDIFNADSVIIDVGCADDPDLSIFFMETYGLKAYGVDPTKKHFYALKLIEKKYSKFKHLPYAVSDKNESLTFYESKDNVSGSLLNNHKNIRRDNIESYEVKGVSISNLIDIVGIDQVDFMKLDLEGAEYSLLDKVRSNELQAIDQLFVEFHHHAIPDKTEKDTWRLVSRIEKLGFRSFTLDGTNYLFYRKDTKN